MKKLISIILASAMILSLTACSKVSDADIEKITEKTNVLTGNEISKATDLKATGTNEEVGFQIDLPENGEEIAIVTTSEGIFKMRLFPEIAPKAVYNFKKHAVDGYYDGLIFHRVIEDFMAQGGDPNGTGTGGESVWGDDFDDEFSDKLLNIKGSVSMANSGPATNGSQFFVNTSSEKPDWTQLETIYVDYYLPQKELFLQSYGNAVNTDLCTDAIRDFYSDHGGNLHLDGALSVTKTGHTVFAQVFEGLEVAENITKVSVDQNAKPTDDVIIESIEIVVYEG